MEIQSLQVQSSKKKSLHSPSTGTKVDQTSFVRKDMLDRDSLWLCLAIRVIIMVEYALNRSPCSR